MKEQHAPKISEDTLTIHVATYLRTQYPHVIFTHIANERKTNVYRKQNGRTYSPQGNKLRQMGVLSGMPDIMIFRPQFREAGTIKYCGIAIELKIGRNKPTDNQNECLVKLAANGWLCKVCYTLDEVIELCEGYFLK